MQGKVLTVASGKGGVGKTTTAVNLAVALWREGNAVALVDADLGMANLAAVLALEPEATLHDVLSGEATPEEAVIEAKGGDLLVLPGERDLTGFANADPGELRTVLADLASRCGYVIVDTGAGLSYEDVLPLGLADEVILVTTPDPAAIWDTSKTLELSGLLDGPIRGVVVTRALDDTDPDSIAAEIGVELLATIPEDPAVTESVSRGDPLESHAPDAPATLAYRELATALIDAAPLPETSLYDELASEADVAEAPVSPTDTTHLEPTGDPGAQETEPAPAGNPDEAPEETDEGSEEPARVDESEDDEPVYSDTAPMDDAADEADDDGLPVDEETAAADELDDVGEDTAESTAPGADETADDADSESAADAEGAADDAGEDDEAEAETDESEVEVADTDASDEEDAAATDEEDGGEESESSEAKRGGFFGWLGQLFS